MTASTHAPLGPSIRSRLLAMLLVGGGLLILLTGLALRFSLHQWLQSELDASLVARVRALATVAEQDFDGVELEVVDGLVPEFQHTAHPAYFQMWLDDGTTLRRSRSLGDADLPRFADTSKRERLADMVLPDGRPGRRVQLDFVPQLDDDLGLHMVLPLDPELLGPSLGLHSATLVIAWGTADLEAAQRRVDRLLAGFGAMFLVLMGLTVPWTLRVGLRPLEQVGREVEALGVDSFHRRIGIARPPAELRPIVDQINGLLDRVEVAFEHERQLSRDLAHELRTPIAELKNLADVGSRWPDDRDSVRQFFADVGGVADQMSSIVTNLLALARSESGTEVVEASRFDVSQAFDEVLDRFEHHAAARGLRFERRWQGPMVVETDRGKLDLILTNLASNAVAYSPEGDVVECSAVGDGDEITVSISNRALDLEDEDLPHLFERFWRKDPARSGGEHVGLGLTLVRTFVDLLGLDLAVDLTAKRRLSFVLRLPAAPR